MSTSSSTATADTASDLLNDLIQTALGLGADAADALMVDGVSLSVSQRLGKREDLERAEGNDLGLRVFIGKRQAIVSATDTSADTLKELVERAVAMAKLGRCSGRAKTGGRDIP